MFSYQQSFLWVKKRDFHLLKHLLGTNVILLGVIESVSSFDS